ncbi:MAG: DUF1425 domain-containing protein [Kiritimatiellaceae bacterium]|nr:DUF1425 domain-containing protein [Kiritimatiellaceae bacterium]
MKEVKTVMYLALIALGVSGLAGCRNTSGTIVKTDHQTGDTAVLTENARLAHRVKVVRTTYDEVNSLKRVHITVQSTSNQRLNVDYRICWFDANGMEIDPQTNPYRNLIIEGHDEVTVTGVANSPLAVSSKLRMRETSQAKLTY